MKITEHNYEEFLIDYLHGELNQTQIHEVETFLQSNDKAREEFELLQQTQFVPDESILFEAKASLLKQEVAKPIIISFRKMLALAAVLSGIVLGLYFVNKPTIKPINDIVKENIPIPAPIQSSSVTKQDSNRSSQAVLPIPNTPSVNPAQAAQSKPKPILAKKKTKPAEIIISQLLKEIIEKQNEIQPQVQVNDSVIVQEVEEITRVIQEEPALAVQVPLKSVPEKGVLVLNDEKLPKLFRFFNNVARLVRKAKQTKTAIANTEVTVMVGNSKILNLN